MAALVLARFETTDFFFQKTKQSSLSHGTSTAILRLLRWNKRNVKERPLVAQCCNLSNETLLFGKIWSFGSIVQWPRVHCRGRGFHHWPKHTSDHSATWPGGWKSQKMDQEELLVNLRTKGRKIDSRSWPRLCDGWRIPLCSSIGHNVMPILVSLRLKHCNVADCSDWLCVVFSPSEM